MAGLIQSLTWIGGAWLALQVFYTLYLAAINVYAHWRELSRAALIFSAPVVVVMLVVDFAMQVTVASLVFLDWPRDWLVTKRLQRYRATGSGWRLKAATWVCTHLLNPFDPTGRHC